MSFIWDTLIDCQEQIIKEFDVRGTEIQEEGMAQFNQPDNGWINRVWQTEDCRRCHIDVVDARDSKALWMMHVCIFPNLENNGPIYGFDVIAGKNKITGAFHDFSPSTDLEHDMINGYNESVADFIPEKKRELPDWAKAIFSGSMISAGNVRDGEELQELLDLCLNNLQYHLRNIGASTDNDLIGVLKPGEFLFTIIRGTGTTTARGTSGTVTAEYFAVEIDANA